MPRCQALLLLLVFLLATTISNGFRPVLPQTSHLTSRQRHLPVPAINKLPTGSTHLASTATVAAEAMLDMGRETHRLQSMATYSTITALVMNACLRLYTSQKFVKDPDTGATRPVQHVFTATSIVCIISGVFTAVLFNILGIYSRECLGMHNDAGYVAFQAATAIYRKWGFRTFLSTCLGFVASFLLSVYEQAITKRQQKKRGLWIFGLAVVLALVAAWEIQHVLSLATKFIYTAEFKAKHEFA